MKKLENLIKVHGFYTFYPKIGYTTIGILSAGTLQIWPCYRGIYSHKTLYTTVGFSVDIILTLAFEADLEYKS